MALGDTKYTVLQVINEVQRRLGLTPTTTLTSNKLSIQMIDFVNNICNEISDLGNWQEMLVSANITAVSGRRDYSIASSAQIKNIGDIFFSNRTGPIRHVTVRDMRIMTRVTAVGQPTQYTVFGTDSNGNPIMRVRPTPGANEAGFPFSITYYVLPPNYTTLDAATVIPFPGDIVVKGVLALAVLNESGGSPTDHYNNLQKDYMDARKEGLNRFNGDSGWEINFTPSMQTRWRR